VLCLRYGAISGPGFQAATTKVLDEEAEELFASPFNCSGTVYGSRFIDTDGVFGSLGDAFEWFPRISDDNVSFEANPPFVVSMLERTVELLASSKRCFKMLLIVPKGEQQAFHNRLLKEFPNASVKLLDNRWIQPPSMQQGKASQVRVIPTVSEEWLIEK